ncbi:MAG: purine-nucleoside phosphorylase [Oscillospiraceae bacterium]
MNEPFAFYEKTAEYVKSRAPFAPELGLILGTGLGPLAKQIENPVEIDYRDIPNFLVSTAPDHAGKLIFGTLEGKKLVCMSGRFHSYEGYDFEQLAIPVRLFKLLGIKQLIVTNAAGGVNEGYRPGDIMVISDHIKLNGASPMRGKNLPEFGDRFFDVSRMYTPRLRELALRLAKDTMLRVHEGVYFFMPGPQFETPAEIRAIRLLGGDAVGMSTVTEALTAAHCGIELLGFSVITNMAAGMLDQPLTTEEVSETGRMIEEQFSAYLKSVIREMNVYE